MTIELPPPGANDIQDHAAMSRRSIDHAREELRKGDRLQASEKLWGAAAHALKSVAIQRGWEHTEHQNILRIAMQLGNEFDRPDFEDKIRFANSFHVNFYENMEEEDSIRRAIEQIESLIADLEEVRAAPPRPFTVANESDRNRLGHLLGRRRSERPAIGSHSKVGFSRTHQEDDKEL
jgi:hypothetical protein